MYIHKIQISNIRSISNLSWEIEVGREAGWHVIIGDNGSGKSTFLRSVALALIGPAQSAALRQDWNSWLKYGNDKGVIRLELMHDERVDKFSGKGNISKNDLSVVINIQRQDDIVEVRSGSSKSKPDRHLWGGKSGWFASSFGAFRRFTGGNEEYKEISYSYPKIASHISVFSESVALTDCISWLLGLHLQKLEQLPEGYLIDKIKNFVNHDNFLPYGTVLEQISSRGVMFKDGNGNMVPVEELGDGYRSILSMVFELIKQIVQTYGYSDMFEPGDDSRIISPGVVFIDEVDVHLHPTWQRNIGKWLCKHFPHIQFIVTTHSPFICQAATNGSVYRLPKPGSNVDGRMITGIELDRLLYGNVLDAYGTEVFGLDMTRSDESKKKLQRLAELNRKELNGGLTEEELLEQEHLRAILPTSAHRT